MLAISLMLLKNTKKPRGDMTEWKLTKKDFMAICAQIVRTELLTNELEKRILEIEDSMEKLIDLIQERE